MHTEMGRGHLSQLQPVLENVAACSRRQKQNQAGGRLKMTEISRKRPAALFENR